VFVIFRIFVLNIIIITIILVVVNLCARIRLVFIGSRTMIIVSIPIAVFVCIIILTVVCIIILTVVAFSSCTISAVIAFNFLVIAVIISRVLFTFNTVSIITDVTAFKFRNDLMMNFCNDDLSIFVAATVSAVDVRGSALNAVGGSYWFSGMRNVQLDARSPFFLQGRNDDVGFLIFISIGDASDVAISIVINTVTFHGVSSVKPTLNDASYNTVELSPLNDVICDVMFDVIVWLCTPCRLNLDHIGKPLRLQRQGGRPLEDHRGQGRVERRGSQSRRKR
jgi:hypothetical protein